MKLFKPGENAKQIALELRSDLDYYILGPMDGELTEFTDEFAEIYGKKESDQLLEMLSSDYVPPFSVLIDLVSFFVGKGYPAQFLETLSEHYIELCRFAYDRKVRVMDLAESIGTKTRPLVKAIANRATPSNARIGEIKRLVSGQQDKPQPQPPSKPEQKTTPKRSPIVHLMIALNSMLGDFLESSSDAEVEKLRTEIGAIDSHSAFQLSNRTNAICSQTALRNYRNGNR